MLKIDLIAAIAAETGLTKTDAAKAIDSFINVVTAALKAGDDVRLRGFGTFMATDLPARQGRNPQTGEPIAVAASRRPRFFPYAALKASM